MSKIDDVRKSKRTDPPGHGKPSRKPRKAKPAEADTMAVPPWEQGPQPTGDGKRPDSKARVKRSSGGKRGERTGTRHRRRNVRPGDDDYTVGYGKPPKDTRFQKGNQAARGRGRPKGSKNRATVVKEIADFKHAVTMPGGKTRKMSLWEAGVWKTGIAAAKGDIKALALLTEFFDRYGIALPEKSAIADPLTQDEEAALQQLFVDRAMENPDHARELLEKILALPQTQPRTDAQHAKSLPADAGGSPPSRTVGEGRIP